MMLSIEGTLADLLSSRRMAPKKVKKDPDAAESSVAASVNALHHTSSKAKGKSRAARSGARKFS